MKGISEKAGYQNNLALFAVHSICLLFSVNYSYNKKNNQPVTYMQGVKFYRLSFHGC